MIDIPIIFLFYFTSYFMSLCIDTTSFEDVSPQGISDDSSTGSRVHGKMWTLIKLIMDILCEC